jgi:hypothetical protein
MRKAGLTGWATAVPPTPAPLGRQQARRIDLLALEISGPLMPAIFGRRLAALRLSGITIKARH